MGCGYSTVRKHNRNLRSNIIYLGDRCWNYLSRHIESAGILERVYLFCKKSTEEEASDFNELLPQCEIEQKTIYL